jgi:hypothetical protein
VRTWLAEEWNHLEEGWSAKGEFQGDQQRVMSRVRGQEETTPGRSQFQRQNAWLRRYIYY